MFSTQSVNRSAQRRGTVLVFVLVTLFVMLGFASLTLDVGALYNARADLQNAADSAALSGASMLATDAMMHARIAKLSSASDVTGAMYSRASGIALQLRSFGADGTHLESGDVKTGWLDLASATSTLDTSKPQYKYNAVQVTARRSKSNANGPLDFFFASIFGKTSTEVSASATAAFDDRIGGYDPGLGGADLWPFTINLTEYNTELVNNSDKYKFDPATGNVSSGSDGMPEVQLYPTKLAPGNFGLLNVGNGNNGTPNLSEDIQNGVTPEDLENEIGTPELNFYDDDGNPLTYVISGNPGLKASLEGDIKSRIGDVLAIPIHTSVSGNGANTKYTIVGVRFVRVMGASLKSGTKGVWVQPVSYSGAGVIINSAAPSSGGAGGRMVLVR